MTRKPKTDGRQVTMDAPDYVAGFAAEDVNVEDCVADIDLSSVVVAEKKAPEGVFGIFQLTCNELGDCEIRKVMIKFPVPAFNRCLRCPKLGVTLAR